MSVKEFDKMCENMIKGKMTPVEKQFYDERQKNLRLKFVIMALSVFGFLLSANTFFMEKIVQWVSYGSSVLIFAAVALAVFVVGASLTGSFFAVNTSGSFTRVIMVIYVVLFLAQALTRLDGAEMAVVDGMLSDNIASVICLALVAVSGIFAVAAYRVQKKRAEKMADED